MYFKDVTDKHYTLKNMKGFHDNIEELTLANTKFRQVLYTSAHSQLVLMCLKPMEEIGMETHEENDQFFRIESGHGKAVVDGHEYLLADGMGIIVPAGAQHNIINTSDTDVMQMYTIYSPAHHEDGTVHVTKADAMKDDEEFEGVTTE